MKPAALASMGLIGQSASITALREHVGRLLQRESEARRLPPILLEGETGTGKGLLARWIHGRSTRAAAPFVDINCAAIPENLLEAELFGFERGAFTDARHAKPGLFQAAHRGVVFLDEVGLLPDGMQGKLLKAIEERVVRRLGSVQTEPVDLWIIAATSDDLRRSTRERRFREDLYHRLAALTLRLPPLRERGEDVLLLAEHFLERACVDYRLPAKTLDDAARQALLRYAWPGNVRELANVMERVALLTDERRVTPAALDLSVGQPTPQSDDPRTDLAQVREAEGDDERGRIVQVLTETEWNISRAAARLGMPRSTLRYRLEKHGIADSPAPIPRDTAKLSPDGTDTRDLAPGLVRPVDWHQRHLVLLRITLVARADGASVNRNQRLLDDLLAKVQSFGGRLDEQGPTGLVAVFGFDLVEDACTRAAHAGLAVQNASQRARQADPSTPAVTCALHAAHVLAGHLGTSMVIDMDDRHQARIVLEALGVDAEDGAIVVSETAAPLLERRFDLERAKATPVLPGPLYRIRGRETTGYGLAGRPLSPFVGRASEMALLDGVLSRANAGHGQLVALVGEPGVGKSRITYELAHTATEHGWVALEAHAASYGAVIPYLPLADLLRRYFRLDDAEGPRAVRDKILAQLSSLFDPLLGTLVAPLLAALGAAVDDDDEWQRLDPPERRERTLDVMKRLLLRESERQPLIVLFEDLHWIDAGTQAFLDRLVEALPTARILLLVNYRPEYRHGWGHKTYYRQLQIDPLPPPMSEAFLDALLGADATLTPVKRLVIERTEGNPFFMEESVHSLVETGVLAGERGAYHATQAVRKLTVPATVEAMLAARMDRLAADDKRLLQIASVIGKDVALPLLLAIADAPEPEVRAQLHRLQAVELLYEARLLPDLEYTFKHALTHDVAYAGLQRERRRDLHAAVAAAIERLHEGRLDEHVERLAHHARHGEVWDKAVRYLRAAGVKVSLRSAHREAATYFEQALDALRRVPKNPDTFAASLDISFDLRNVLFPLGELQRIETLLDEAEALAKAASDQRRLGRVLTYKIVRFGMTGDFQLALQAGRRALAIAEAHADVPIQVVANGFLGWVSVAYGEYREAVRHCEAVVALIPEALTHERFGQTAISSSQARSNLAVALGELGRFSEALTRLHEACDIAEEGRHAYTLLFPLVSLGTVRLERGDFAEAVAPLERGMDLCQRTETQFFEFAWALGAAYHRTGRRAEGIALMEDSSRRSAERIPRGGRWPGHVTALGAAYLLDGRLADATRIAHQELAVLRQRTNLGVEGRVLRLLGDIASHPDGFDFDNAEEHYRRAQALAEARGLRPLLAHCHLGFGRLYRRAGRPEHAREHLQIAAAMYHEMTMEYWLAEAKSEAAELG